MTHKQMTHKFIVAIGTNFNREAHAEAAVEALNRGKKKRERRSPMYRNEPDAEPDAKKQEAPDDSSLNLSASEFDLSHISAREQSREDIIAAAEAAAFGE